MTRSEFKFSTRATAVAVALAGGVTGLGVAITVDAVSSSDPRTPSPALVEFARDNHLSGLSPASLQPIDPRRTTYSQVAELARDNGLTGLSPASLSPHQPGAQR